MIRMPAMTVNKWRALSLNRLAHLTELKRTGRWHRMFANEDVLEQALREATVDAEKCKRLAYQETGRIVEAAE